jgi:hypothetical protein
MDHRTWIAALGGAISLLVPSLTASAADAPQPIRARPYLNQLYVTVTPKSADEVVRIWTSGATIVEPHDPSIAPHQLAVTPGLLSQLRTEGLDVQVVHGDFQALVDESYEKWERVSSPAGYVSALPTFFDKSQDLSTISTFVDEQVKGSSGRATIAVAGKGHQGNEIRVVRVSSSPRTMIAPPSSSPPRIMLANGYRLWSAPA